MSAKRIFDAKITALPIPAVCPPTRVLRVANPENAAMLYIDGHVRVYHGKKARLPKHSIARQRLCLHATCDYWVNTMNGEPFFLVPKDVDPGLLQVLEHEIVPEIEKKIPCQPSKEELKKAPLLHRFVLVFDREGYSLNSRKFYN